MAQYEYQPAQTPVMWGLPTPHVVPPTSNGVQTMMAPPHAGNPAVVPMPAPQQSVPQQPTFPAQHTATGPFYSPSAMYAAPRQQLNYYNGQGVMCSPVRPVAPTQVVPNATPPQQQPVSFVPQQQQPAAYSAGPTNAVYMAQAPQSVTSGYKPGGQVYPYIPLVQSPMHSPCVQKLPVAPSTSPQVKTTNPTTGRLVLHQTSVAASSQSSGVQTVLFSSSSPSPVGRPHAPVKAAPRRGTPVQPGTSGFAAKLGVWTLERICLCGDLLPCPLLAWSLG